MRDALIDRVEAIYCSAWPLEAAEWITREQKNGWPSKFVVGKIVGSGCHLVPKAHPSNPGYETHWRFSFSVAEAILIHSWTDVQKYIYHVLRLIKNEVVECCGGEGKTALHLLLQDDNSLGLRRKTSRILDRREPGDICR